MKKHAFKIARAALDAVKGEECIYNFIKRKGDFIYIKGKEYNLDKYENIYIIGAGKASASMAKGIEKLLLDKIKEGEVVTKDGYIVDLKRIRLTEASHPIPDKRGLQAAERIYNIAKKATSKDLIVLLLSGGASALLPFPEDNITLEEKQEATEVLINCGASIEEINTIRKHISKIKGGKLAYAAYPAIVLSFIISDVVEDKLEAIGSGLTVPDLTTFNDCSLIIEKYDLMCSLPKSIIQFIKDGVEQEKNIKKTYPKEAFKKVKNFIIANNLMAAEAAKSVAENLGYHTIILSTRMNGSIEEMCKFHSSIIKEIIVSDNPIKKPACLISGGEGTIKIKGKGRGGRNTHFALLMLQHLKGLKDYFLLSFGTDGSDGATPAAGAYIYSGTFSNAVRMGLGPDAYIRNYDSYSFFKKLNSLFITGPTHTNVMDLRIILIR